ncbi:MAG: signal peptidase I [Candidatus Pacebacteria bacterium]|nr:signal peptidase I [Candidatus Paceibacterota bacterium]MCD8508127.1 signal peptidase I [Candidatus Paceibacterota bacterium]MCD8527800.1 signal peptidase I [Candidatus Paceibacterota bacterium]MCD8563763.1 signal peptidase I [Candidatus Paceibacterota bacterium]
MHHETLEKQSTPESTEPTLKEQIIEIIRFVVIAAVIVIPVRVFIAQPFIVSGTSMIPTFEHRDYLIIDEISYRFREPQRGDVIVFRYPEQPSQFFIKRIIALPRETVRITDSVVTITSEEDPTGFILEEMYLPENTETLARNESLTLPDDYYFVMGDNRSFSSDSRIWGPLPRDLIVGKAWLRLWPLNNIGFKPGSHSFDILSDNNDIL